MYHLKSKVLEYRAKTTTEMSLPQYFWSCTVHITITVHVLLLHITIYRVLHFLVAASWENKTQCRTMTSQYNHRCHTSICIIMQWKCITCKHLTHITPPHCHNHNITLVSTSKKCFHENSPSGTPLSSI
jgi:hypothetical protein